MDQSPNMIQKATKEIAESCYCMCFKFKYLCRGIPRSNHRMIVSSGKQGRRKREGVGAIGMETKELLTVFEVCFLSLKISESNIANF